MEAARSVEVALVEVAHLDRRGATERLRELAERCPNLPIVVVTEERPTNLKHLRHIVVAEVLFLSELDRLPGMLRSLEPFQGREYLAKRIRDSGVHLRLKQALLHPVHQLRTSLRLDLSGREPIPRSVRELARRQRVSPSWLSTLASREGVPLRAFVSGVLALQALELMAGGKELANAATLLGYKSPGALSNRVQRTFGKRPRQLVEGGSLRSLYEEVAALVQTEEERSGQGEEIGGRG